MSIRVPFDERKAVEAASFFLSQNRGRMDRWRLNKIMYIAEREAWDRYNREMFGGTYCSLPKGPIVSEILDLTRGRQPPGCGRVWIEHFENGGREGVEVILLKDAGFARLGRGDIGILRSVYDKYAKLPFGTLKVAVHAFPEYEERSKGQSPIPVETLLQKLHRSELVPAVKERIEEERQIEQSFRKLKGCRR